MADVTIVVSPRERFNYSQASLKSIYENTSYPFRLIYVDGNSPKDISQFLVKMSAEKGFKYIRCEHFLTPNQARNVALASVDTDYVVFIDNDIFAAPGWLESLVRCAEETGAWAVGPLYFEGQIEDQVVHMAGGVAHFFEHEGKRRIKESHISKGKTYHRLQSHLKKRQPTELIEFHCALVRTVAFESLGQFDEGLMTVMEHVDLCLAIHQAGQTVYFEPEAKITYVAPPPFTWSDLRYFLIRWCDKWNKTTIDTFRDKWNLEPDDPYFKRINLFIARHRRLLFEPGYSKLRKSLPGRRAGILLDAVVDRTLKVASDLAIAATKTEPTHNR